MRVYLAGTSSMKNENVLKQCNYALESFYSIKDYQLPFLLNAKSFMLDSGAFTFSKGKIVDFDSYLERYADFINKHDVKLFFELDIDNIIGYDKVLEMRKRLEN